ncbi:hypothetical protein ACQ4PT_048440 [Festuca glaucescens]
MFAPVVVCIVRLKVSSPGTPPVSGVGGKALGSSASTTKHGNFRSSVGAASCSSRRMQEDQDRAKPGPLRFIIEPYDGTTIPRLQYHPYSWTKAASVLFLDSPVGAGFSFSRDPNGYDVGDVSSTLQVKNFLTKWFTEHLDYLANPFYVGGSSRSGKIAPFLAQIISEGGTILSRHSLILGALNRIVYSYFNTLLFSDTEAGIKPIVNLKGYLVGNPSTGESIDDDSKVPYLHGVGIIPDQLYEVFTWTQLQLFINRLLSCS